MTQLEGSVDSFRRSNKQKALRLVALAELLREAPRSKDEIMAHFSALEVAVSKRSVERCLRDLYDLGLGLNMVKDPSTRVQRYFIPPKR
jgi:predicted DNA-binding transcriptional regulator YafY